MRSGLVLGALGALGALGTLVLATPAAHADVLSLYGEVHGGYSGGKGQSGALKDEAFHANADGGAYGFKVGAEVLLIDGWVQHDQYRTGDGLVGTWTQLMAGLDTEIPTGEKEGADAQGKGGYASSYVELGAAIGFGVGTGQQVMPPLDNSEVTDKGFLLQGAAGFAWRLTEQVSFGVTVPVQVGYLFKNGAEAVANDVDDQYVELSFAALASLRLDLDIK